MAILFVCLLAATAAERVVELVVSRRNAAWARKRGAVEVGFGHWPVMVALHVFFFVGPLLEVTLLHRPFEPRLGYPMLSLAVVAQLLRYWCITTLGRRWNVRVFVLPGVPAVVRGPYRYLRHPNYVAVVLEGICVPLVHGAYWSCIAFTLANALLLHTRIRTEQGALETYGTAYARVGWGGR